MEPLKMTTIAEMKPGGASVINSFEIPLANGPAAQAYRRSVIGSATGRYDVLTNNCYGHCLKVLQAGGVQGLPSNRGFVPWLFALPRDP